jgi:hypothetical protein
MNVMKVISATGPDPALAQGGHIRRFFGVYYRNPVQVQSFLDVFSDGWMCQLRVARRTACASCIASRRPVAPKGRGC